MAIRIKARGSETRCLLLTGEGRGLCAGANPQDDSDELFSDGSFISDEGARPTTDEDARSHLPQSAAASRHAPTTEMHASSHLPQSAAASRHAPTTEMHASSRELASPKLSCSFPASAEDC